MKLANSLELGMYSFQVSIKDLTRGQINRAFTILTSNNSLFVTIGTEHMNVGVKGFS